MSYSNDIFENVTIGTSVVTVSATDSDSGGGRSQPAEHGGTTQIMKRHKPSGDFYRKQKKAREEENKKNKGSLLKYFDSTTESAESEVDREASTSATPNQKAVSSSSGGLTEFEDLPNEPAVVGEQLKLLVEDESYEVIDTLDIQDGSISDYKDIGTWPISITDNLRTLLVT
ncbi:unnamed protein product [Acanthoscelides obtectus]|uniref:Uncharacterized protein n=1 Tax=Acanthoscelides obtectus TaxID=200917 RepID=A0A9P0MGH5_ACAOB|nr:unnamed protein product [Acanthoscelides obtectus]CAK1631791.1 hypothetical protein AOBTE_LOCUS7163 [Acanthoscelides obtectus]